MEVRDEGRALIRQIFANPEEDTLRLIYADWLDENAEHAEILHRTGQEMHDQAELIRLMVRLARDPSSRTNADTERENELRQQMIDALGPKIAPTIRDDPDRITFDRGFICYLNLTGTPITARPEGLQVGGDLNLTETPITSLPKGLQVGGTLSLSGTPITSLPEDLQVGGGLYLSRTQIASLPVGLKVGGDLDLSNTQVTSLPAGLQVGGNLNLFGTQVTALPAGLQVGGNLNLGHTPITEEAARRIPEMPGLSTRAKITGLRTAGYETLAEQVGRHESTSRAQGGAT